MRLNNKKDFSSKDFIEFARRGPRSAEEKSNIKKGLKKFWDKKGRAVMTVGGGAAAVGGALTLAAKSGKIPMPGKNKMTQKSQGLIGGAGPQQKLLPPGKGGVDSQPRVIVTPAPDGNASMTVSGSKGARMIDEISNALGTRAKAAAKGVKKTPGAVREGYRTAKPSDPGYQVGAKAAEVFAKAKQRLNKRNKKS